MCLRMRLGFLVSASGQRNVINENESSKLGISSCQESLQQNRRRQANVCPVCTSEFPNIRVFKESRRIVFFDSMQGKSIFSLITLFPPSLSWQVYFLRGEKK